MTSASQPPVTVVTPVYNGEKYLSECIESVLRQSYTNWEYVLLDNASTDRTPEIIGRFAATDGRIRVHRNDETVPYIDNWNRAVALMDRGSAYCKVLHADDWLEAECLTRMVDLAERHESAGMVGSWIQRGSEVMARWDGARDEVLNGRELGRLALLAEVPYLFGSPSALLLRSDLVRARDPLYPHVDHPLVDQHLCYDLLRETDFGYIQATLSYNRLHEASITAGQEDTNQWFYGKLSLLAAHGAFFLEQEELDARVDHYLDRYYRFLARQVGRARGRDFWSYHAGALAEVGVPLDRSRLWREALSEMPGRVKRRVSRRPASESNPVT